MTAKFSQKLQANEKQAMRIVNSLNRMIEGRLDAYGRVTLTPNATTTEVAGDATQFVSENSVISLSPRTAHAAAALATTYISAVVNGGFTLTHANNSQDDRTFDFSWIG
jgi:hypothetical protein